MSEKPIIVSGPMVRAILDGRKTQTRRIVNLDALRVRLPGAVRSDNCGVTELDIVVKPIVARAATYRARLNRAGAVTLSDGRLAGDLGVKPGEFHFVCPYAEGDTHLGVYGNDDKRWTIAPRPSRLWVRETFAVETNRDWSNSTEYPPPFSDGRPIDWHEDDTHGKWWRQCHYRATEPKHDLVDPDGEDNESLGWTPSIYMSRWASRITLHVSSVRLERLHDISEDDARREGVGNVMVTDRDLAPGVGDAMGKAFRERGRVAMYAVMWDHINAKRATWASNPWVWTITFYKVPSIAEDNGTALLLAGVPS